MTTTDYPAYEPPAGVPSGPASQWSRREAKAYFAWLMAVKDDRVTHLLKVLDVTTGEPEVMLIQAGENAARLIRAFNPGTDVIDARSRAIAADMGLLVASLLCEARRTIKWQIVTRPPRDVCYNLPALHGFGRLHLDPIGVSLVQTEGLLKGAAEQRCWLEIFRNWLALADST